MLCKISKLNFKRRINLSIEIYSTKILKVLLLQRTDAKDSSGVAFQSGVSRTHFKGASGASFGFFCNWDKPCLCCDATGLQMQVSKDADPQLRHS